MSGIEVGSVVGGVRIEAEIGRGGMGVVYRGRQLALNRTVALKVVRADLAEQQEFRERFKREAEIAASLDHPHVVPVHAAGEDADQLYVTMRYVDGADLGRVIAERGLLDPALAAEVVAQVGAALDAAHRRGLVHRDVKPANIVLADQDGHPHAYLMDFGLSRAAAAGSGFTRTGTVIGSVDYMAPEQFEGGPVDGRVDVYALGCVLFQALTGQVPFPRDTEPAKIWAHMKMDPPALATLVPDAPAGLGAVLRKAMAKRPDDRYASAGELGRAGVAAVAEGGSVGAAEPVVAMPAGAETVVVERPDTAELARAADGPSGSLVDPTAGSAGDVAGGSPVGAVAGSWAGSAAEPQVGSPGGSAADVRADGPGGSGVDAVGGSRVGLAAGSAADPEAGSPGEPVAGARVDVPGGSVAGASAGSGAGSPGGSGSAGARADVPEGSPAESRAGSPGGSPADPQAASRADRPPGPAAGAPAGPPGVHGADPRADAAAGPAPGPSAGQIAGPRVGPVGRSAGESWRYPSAGEPGVGPVTGSAAEPRRYPPAARAPGQWADPPAGPPVGPAATSPPPRNRRPLVLGIAVAVVAALAVVAAVVLWPRADRTPPAPTAAPTAAGTLLGPPIAVGKEPLDIDPGEGFLWTANASDGTISKIDPAAGTSQQIPVGGAPAELAVADGSVWVRNFPDAITRVDVASGRVDEPIQVRREIDGITAGGGFLWLSHSSSGTVSRIDMQSRAVEGNPTKVGTKPTALAWGDRRLGERRLFVADPADHTLTTIDGGTAKVLGAPLPLAGEPGAVEEYQGVLYIGIPGGVIPIDERSRVVGDTIPLKGGSLFAPDAEGVWVAFPLQNELRRFDLHGSETRGDPLPGVGRGLGDMVLVDGVLWVTNSDEGTVSRIRVS